MKFIFYVLLGILALILISIFSALLLFAAVGFVVWLIARGVYFVIFKEEKQ